MPIKQITPKSKVNQMVDKAVEDADKAIFYQLNVIGEECFKAMRDYSGKAYQDQTGNLRASSGFVIIRDGKVVSKADFSAINGKGEDGVKEGLKFSDEVASKFPSGYTLVLLSGMEYATYVDDKGYNVLDSARLVSRILLNDLKYKLSKK